MIHSRGKGFQMSNALGNNGGRFYSFLNRPVLIDCNFIVDATNGNSLGIRNLKGSGVRAVYMNTTASFSGTTHTNTTIDGIASGTSSLVVGMKLSGSGIAAGTTILSINSSSAITVSLATTASATVTISTVAPGSPNPAAGFALIQLRENYRRYCGGFSGFVSPSTGGTIAINGTALTVGNPYIIASVGHATAGTVTIAPVADVSGSLASTWFRIYDAYGNTFIIWFSVSGVGAAPIGVSGTLVQQSITTNETAANIGAALVITLENLLAAQPGNLQAPAGVNSFTATGTTTVTVVSTATNPYGPLPGVPMDGTIPTGFTFANVDFNTNQQNWNQVGLLPGVVPNIGASFIATATGSSTGGGSTGLVVAPGISGITSIEVVGDPNQSFAPIPFAGSTNHGAWILVQFLAPTSSSTTTLIPTAPAQNTVVGMSFYVNLSSVAVDGE
jgi:hypothetical protein